MSDGQLPSGLNEITSEDEWHEFLVEALEAAGWYVKHEVKANGANRRCDFLCYHGEFNQSYDSGEWVGLEAKYCGHDFRPRGVQAAKQIDKKYRDKSWLSSGEEVDLWAVAPYTAAAHRGNGEELIAARAAEVGQARALTTAGTGYLFSWHPCPSIVFDNSLMPRQLFFGDDDYVSPIQLPAFYSQETEQWSASADEDECERLAAIVRAVRGSNGFAVDSSAVREAEEPFLDMGIGPAGAFDA